MSCCNVTFNKNYKCDNAACMCIPTDGKSCICVCENENGDFVRCDDCKCISDCQCKCDDSKCTCIVTNGAKCICVCRDDEGNIKTCDCCTPEVGTKCCKERNVKKQCCSQKEEEVCGENCGGKARKSGCICLPTGGKSCICLCENDKDDIVRCDDCKCIPGSCQRSSNAKRYKKAGCAEQKGKSLRCVGANKDNSNCVCLPTDGKSCICVCKNEKGDIIRCDDCKCIPDDYQRCCSAKCNTKAGYICADKKGNNLRCVGGNKDCVCLPTDGKSCICVCKNEKGYIIRCDDCKCIPDDYQRCCSAKCNTKAGYICADKKDNNLRCVGGNKDCVCLPTDGKSCICVCKNEKGDIIRCDDCKCIPNDCQHHCNSNCNCFATKNTLKSDCCGKSGRQGCNSKTSQELDCICIPTGGKSCICVCTDEEGDLVCCDDCKCITNNCQGKCTSEKTNIDSNKEFNCCHNEKREKTKDCCSNIKRNTGEGCSKSYKCCKEDKNSGYTKNCCVSHDTVCCKGNKQTHALVPITKNQSCCVNSSGDFFANPKEEAVDTCCCIAVPSKSAFENEEENACCCIDCNSNDYDKGCACVANVKTCRGQLTKQSKNRNSSCCNNGKHCSDYFKSSTCNHKRETACCDGEGKICCDTRVGCCADASTTRCSTKKNCCKHC